VEKEYLVRSVTETGHVQAAFRPKVAAPPRLSSTVVSFQA
jgi:hypothetical protein